MGDSNIYKGADYGFEPKDDNDPFGAPIGDRYSIKAGQFGVTTDPRSANQLKEVSDKLSTGAKTIEVSGISTEVLESIPEQHLTEIARLKKLAGADITFHGPLVEPTGFNQQGNWDESLRLNAERQIWDAVKRGQVMNSEGNLVVTLHTSNGLMSPKTIMKDKDAKDIGVEHGKQSDIFVIDEYTGKAGVLPDQLLQKDAFEGEKFAPTPEQAIKKINEKLWNREVESLSLDVLKGRETINKALTIRQRDSEDEGLSINDLNEIKDLFKLYREDPEKYRRAIETTDKLKDPVFREIVDNRVTNLAHGYSFLQNSYQGFKEIYGKAVEALEKEKNNPKAKQSLDRLEAFRKEAAPVISKYNEDPLKIKEFDSKLEEGFRILSSLDYKPQQYKPIEDFAIDKASDTFSNVATNAYKQFGKNAPILSLENPPVGMGLSRADEIVKLVEATRKKLTKNLQDEGLSEKEAKKTAEKIVGVTWDVGHINMLKKYGFDDKDIVHETEKVKPFLKHIHLSDNFGIEHTELPMGMGNVPMRGHIEAIGDKIKEFKHIIETGGHWYQDFKVSPLAETLSAFGSQLYPMAMQPHWDQAQASSLGSGYFSGYGFNPDIHHSIYGSSFTTLPKELGGQIAGRSRLSGNALE